MKPVASETLQLEFVDCPLCGSKDSDIWARENGYNAVKCRQCALVYVNPRPPLNSISEATKTGVHKTDTGDLTVTFRRSSRKQHRYRSIVQTMFAAEIAAGKPLSWLDIGAGYGEFVEAVLSALPAGSRVSGIEPMKPKVEVARARGLPILDVPLSRVEGQFEVISLINVFSHIPDFKDFLRQAVDHCSPQGMVFIETGNGGDIDRVRYPDELFLPDHLVFAGIRHIDLFLKDAGFRTVLVHQRRVDTARYVVRRAVKGLLEGRLEIAAPYVSPFRTVFFKAQRQ